MIEDIKKEILENHKTQIRYFMANGVPQSENVFNDLSVEELFEILDKYKFRNETLNKIDNIENYIEELEKRNNEYLNDLEKFHNAWEELKETVLGEDKNGKLIYFKTDGTMQNLEDKHNIGREE